MYFKDVNLKESPSSWRYIRGSIQVTLRKFKNIKEI